VGKEREEADAPLNKKPTRLLYPNRGRAWKRALSIPGETMRVLAPLTPCRPLRCYIMRHSRRTGRLLQLREEQNARSHLRADFHRDCTASNEAAFSARSSVYIMTGKVNLIGSEYSTLHRKLPAPD